MLQNAFAITRGWGPLLGLTLAVAGCDPEEILRGVHGHGPRPAPMAQPTLAGRAVLPAATFAPGPTSGSLIGTGPINGQAVPFSEKQPVQGLSGALDLGGGHYLVLADNGFGRMENSSDFLLRAYQVFIDPKTKDGGTGEFVVNDFISFRDPDGKIPWAITNHFSEQRLLTGADFDVESIQRAPDGSLWVGDEFGPFLLHFDATGKLLEAPYALPDFSRGAYAEIRSPQNPQSEEGSAVRIMNAVRAHAREHGSLKTPVFSPWAVMLEDGDSGTFVDSRRAPPPGSGVVPAASDVFDVASLQAAGYDVVTWTVNDPAQMTALLELKVDGIISDRPDLLLAAIRGFDANKDGTPGDLLDADGLIDITRIDAQGHRGARDLRPENTIPAFEAALDHLVTTLELDTGGTRDGVVVLSHDPHLLSEKCRRTDGVAYGPGDELLIKELRAAELQLGFACDKLFRGPEQKNDPALSPVAAAFMAGQKLGLHAVPKLSQVFDFVAAYVAHYTSGAGAGHPEAGKRAKNAARVRFNIETKLNPRKGFEDFTVEPAPFARRVARVIEKYGFEDRADVQSFDFRTLLHVQAKHPAIRTVYLFGDFPVFDDPKIAGSDDGTNLQGEAGGNTPWLAGLTWPYRATARTYPFRSPRSGGFEGVALSSDGRRLLPLLELPLVGDDPKRLLIHEFDLASRAYTGLAWHYSLDARGTNVGDFIMTGPSKGLVIERDGSSGRLDGFKVLYEITLGAPGTAVTKRLLANLLEINDPHGISGPGAPGDVGLGPVFAFPFETIEDVIFLGGRRVALFNDNNYPFSVGRHVGQKLADDNEFIIVDLGQPIARD